MAPASIASGRGLGKQDGEVPLALVRALRPFVATATGSHRPFQLGPRFFSLPVHQRT